MTTPKKTLSLIAMAAAVAAAPALSFADDHDWHDHDRAEHVDRDWHEHDRDGADRVDHDRGAGHYHWHRGDRVSTDYMGPRYEVRDWRAHHLRQPPRGYHWVQVDGDFVLAAIATGVIADVMLNQ
jgi:Ni/Co efflux regulator RcnB